MKYCVIYKTRVKQGLYLYVREKDQFKDVPDALMTQFGRPELVMVLPFSGNKSPAKIDKATLIKTLEEQGYYLQLPPKEENFLESHRESLGLDPKPPKKDL